MDLNNKEIVEKKAFGKWCLGILAIYICLIVLFPILAGENMLIRDSRGNREMLVCEDATVELSEGQVIEQSFRANIMRIKTVEVQFGAYYRTNQGTICIQIIREADGEILGEQMYDASVVMEGTILELVMEKPIEECYGVPLLVRIFSDSQKGQAVTPLRSYAKTEEALTINGETMEGSLCFGVTGEDYIWSGLHYWKFAIGFGVLLALVVLFEFYLFCKDRSGYVIGVYYAINRYRYLIKQLVRRDFKVKYKRSVLGFLWSFLNPLLMLVVQYVVFSTVFQADIKHYPAYLILGIICYNFFTEAVGMALTSIVGNASLITKVYMPKYIYPLTRVVSSCVNLLISLVPLTLVCLITGVQFNKAAILSLFFLFCHIIFTLGLGVLLSASMVFFRDTQFLWGIISMVWMYATPIFYPASILPKNVQMLLRFNPLYHFIQNIRMCIIEGISPEPFAYVQCFFISFVMLLLGAMVFKKTQNKFLLYI